MEDLSCSNPLTSFINPSSVKFHQSKRHWQCVMAFHKQSLNLKAARWLPVPHKRTKMFAFAIMTDFLQTEDNKPTSTQDGIVGDVDDEAFHEKHSALNTAENAETLTTSNAQLSPILEAQCDYGHIANAIAAHNSKMVVFAPEMFPSNDPHNTLSVHAYNNNIHTHSEIIREERILKRKSQQLTYLFAALASSVGISSLAGASVYYRFAWQMEGGEVPWTEMLGTFSLALGAAVGMEYWARWAHRALWHASLWNMHESHHQPRDGPFELNDVFAIINAVPAIALMAFGFLHKGLVPGLCFGAGLGITIFGIAYMFVHDGLVHRRFPVGPIADVPYFQRVAAAHQLHHADKFNGVPYGLFLGPMELEEVGGRTELEKLLQKRKREKTNPINN